VAPGSKRVIKPKKTGKVTHPPRTVSKVTQVSRTVIIPRDSLTPNFSALATNLGSDLTRVPENTIPTTSLSAVINPVEVRNPVEASGGEAMVVQPNDLSIGVVHASDVIEIGDEPEELEQEASEVRSATKRKGKEVASESLKRTRFAPDPLEDEPEESLKPSFFLVGRALYCPPCQLHGRNRLKNPGLRIGLRLRR